MTDSQKMKVSELMEQGFGYRAISSMLDLPLDTVKSWCRRHTRGPKICRQCGGKITRIPHKREKKFCCDRCRMIWWNEHPQLKNTNVSYDHTCSGCGKGFKSNRKNSVYCSWECYVNHRGDHHD